MGNNFVDLMMLLRETKKSLPYLDKARTSGPPLVMQNQAERVGVVLTTSGLASDKYCYRIVDAYYDFCSNYTFKVHLLLGNVRRFSQEVDIVSISRKNSNYIVRNKRICIYNKPSFTGIDLVLFWVDLPKDILTSSE